MLVVCSLYTYLLKWKHAKAPCLRKTRTCKYLCWRVLILSFPLIIISTKKFCHDDSFKHANSHQIQNLHPFKSFYKSSLVWYISICSIYKIWSHELIVHLSDYLSIYIYDKRISYFKWILVKAYINENQINYIIA